MFFFVKWSCTKLIGVGGGGGGPKIVNLDGPDAAIAIKEPTETIR